MPANRQLWSGAGRHLCLGGPLAQAEEAARIVELLMGDGGWSRRVVSLGLRAQVLIPAYESLVVRKTA